MRELAALEWMSGIGVGGEIRSCRGGTGARWRECCGEFCVCVVGVCGTEFFQGEGVFFFGPGFGGFFGGGGGVGRVPPPNFFFPLILSVM